MRSDYKGYIILPAPVWPRQLPYVANYSVFKRGAAGPVLIHQGYVAGVFPKDGMSWAAAETAGKVFIDGLAQS